ncbi:siderophore-interacting protein [Arthrobacter sp. AK01]|uniref:siderophore-interacting protein n=1 Tax=Micrococcaceae TaxID=1268 RepID=UPI001E2A4CF0|nr:MULTISPECIES: siderophore-interacting protein [Micrococcaceae]MCD4849561.1 siderophore-interacting protein [Arthrobacter sp. AK01]MCP1411053.1 NADPH-dependent ferric siderophore reductase [Paenarthrobacter sp. A20]
MKRNWEGVVLKVMGAKDFTLEVTGKEEITPDFLRVHVRDGGLLERSGLHPTMWIRLWFDDSGKAHQRAYTLVNASPAAGTFSMDFAMHNGVAADWARSASAGDTIDATVQGSSFTFPQPSPRRIWVVGDPASIPAINSLLDERQLSAAGGAPVSAWLEYQHDADPSLEVRTSDSDVVTWIPRKRDGAALVEEVCGALTAETVSVDSDFFWIACEASSTRAIVKHLRKTLGVDKHRIDALGYWRV